MIKKHNDEIKKLINSLYTFEDIHAKSIKIMEKDIQTYCSYGFFIMCTMSVGLAYVILTKNITHVIPKIKIF